MRTSSGKPIRASSSNAPTLGSAWRRLEQPHVEDPPFAAALLDAAEHLAADPATTADAPADRARRVLELLATRA